MLKPIARKEDLMTEELTGEVIVYDKTNHQSHCLNKAMALIWQSSNGQRTVEEIATRLEDELNVGTDVNTIVKALKDLDKASLLEPGYGMQEPAQPSRRTMARRLALASVTSAIIPIISTIVAPTPAAAESNQGGHGHGHGHGHRHGQDPSWP